MDAVPFKVVYPMVLISMVYPLPTVTAQINFTTDEPRESMCFCFTTRRDIVADCSQRYLERIPSIPGNTTKLIMQYTRIQQLADHQFVKSKMLRVINLSQNMIASVSAKSFAGLDHLEVIDISNNKINVLACSLINLKQLQSLNVSYNELHNLTQSTIKELDGLSTNRSRRISVDLTGNKLLCNCDTKPFLQWLLETAISFPFNNTYTCTLANGTMARFYSSLDEVVETLKTECFISVGNSTDLVKSFLIGISLIFVATLLLVGTVVMWRRKLRERRQDDEHIYEYDAFISYEHADHTVGHDESILELEEKRGLHLCVHEREFLPGERIAANISNGISNSKRIILLISTEFLNSHWCMFELDVARTRAIEGRRNLILIVMLEDIPSSDMMPEVSDMTNVYTYLRYPVGQGEHDKAVFWDKCAEFIKEDYRAVAGVHSRCYVF